MAAVKERLERFVSGKDLNQVDFEWFFSELFKGQLSDAQTAAVLTSLRIHGEPSSALLTGARDMREHAVKPAAIESMGELTDNCGTGGDGVASFNISTASALVAGSLGVRMAKHGNRSVSSKCGSADLLFAAGYPDSLSAEESSKLLTKHNFAFFFAPNFHPVMKHVMPVRKDLGVRTIFNLLGPLANPLKPAYQLLGVSRKVYIRPMAEALAKLGVKRAYVVHSRDGMDELSPCAPTDGVFIDNGQLSEMNFDPETLGITGHMQELVGGDASVNLQLLQNLLNGTWNTIAEAVALNAGAVLFVSNRTDSIADGYTSAKQALLSGSVGSYFEDLLNSAKELSIG